MKLFKKTWFRILTVVALMLLLLAAVNLYTKQLPSNFTVTTTGGGDGDPGGGSVPGLTIYSDAGATVELTTLAWGSINQGAVSTKGVWVKNTGNVAFSSVTISSTLSPSVGTVTAPAIASLPVGSVAPMSLTVMVKPSAPSGLQSFTTEFKGAY